MTIVRELVVPHISDAALEPGEARQQLESREHHDIDVVNWDAFGYAPEVKFAVGYGADELYVHFDVREKAVLARHTESNAAVCQDSCVEFFFAPSEDVYFNIEFSCIGTALVGKGRDRHDRENLPPALIKTIRRATSLGTEPFEERLQETQWWLTAAIPLALLDLSPATLPGQTCYANFYKCGDALSTPHYLSWNPVGSPSPDCHRPECFGRVRFA